MADFRWRIGITLTDAVETMLTRHLLSIVDFPKSMVHPKGIEDRHDIRVAIRRLDAVLATFKGIIDRSKVDAELKQIAHLRKALGKVRDLDLFIELVERWNTSNSNAAYDLKEVVTRCTKDRRKKLERLEVAVGQFSGQHVQDDLIKRFGAAIDREHDEVSLEVAGKALLAPLLDAYASAIAEVEKDALSTQAWHHLRIQGKYLRYALEELRSHVIADQRLLAILKQSQESIGAMHDCVAQLLRIDSMIEKAEHPAKGARKFEGLQKLLRERWEESRVAAMKELPEIRESLKAV